MPQPLITAAGLLALIEATLRAVADGRNADAARYGGPRWEVKALANGTLTVTATQRGQPDTRVVIGASDL